MQQQQNPPIQSIRKWARKACEPCRKRKRRCDGALPCRACLEYEYACHYEPQAVDTTGKPPVDTTATDPSPSVVWKLPVGASTDRNKDEEVRPPGGIPAPLSGRVVAGKFPYRNLLYRSRADFPRAVADGFGQSPSISGNDFGYNFGIPARINTVSEPTIENLASAMSLDEAETFCRLYCGTCGLLFPLVKSDLLLDELRRTWLATSSQLSVSHIEVAITFAVLLRSYFSWPHLTPKHDALFLHAQTELDRLTFRQPAMDHWLLRAWILKTLLLRLMGTPIPVWLSSCNMIQVAEPIDGTIQQEDLFAATAGLGDSDQGHNVFVIARTMHQIISLETGRSVMLNPAAGFSRDVEHDQHELDSAHQLQETFRHIQDATIDTPNRTAMTCLLDLCHHRIASNHPLDPRAYLIEASLACALYRQSFRQEDSSEIQVIDTIKKFLEEALTAAENLGETDEPWFMLADFPSQETCMALALGRPHLELLPRLLGLLAAVTKKFKSEALRETEKTLALLVEAYLASRDEEATTLREALKLLSYNSDRSASLEDEVWSQFVG